MLDTAAALTALGRTSMDRGYKPDSVPVVGSVIYLSPSGGLVAINPKLTLHAEQAGMEEEAGSLQLPI